MLLQQLRPTPGSLPWIWQEQQTHLANIVLNDSVLLTLGSVDGTDVDLYYDATDLQIDVNSGGIQVTAGNIAFGTAVRPADYVSVGRPTETVAGGNDESILNVFSAGALTLNTDAVSIVAGLRVGTPNITEGTGTVTTAASIYVSGAPTEGDNNYSLFVDAGLVRFDNSLFINELLNANMAIGLTINQGANDDQILALKSSDVGTGLTTIVLGGDVEIDDFFTIAKASATLGGAHIQVLAQSTLATPLIVDSWGGAPATTDTSASLAAMNFFVGLHDNSNADVDMATDSNAIAWGEINASNARLTRMLLKADDGELHLQNTTIADLAADSQDDRMVVRAMQKLSAEDIIETQHDNPFFDHQWLVDQHLAGPKDEEGFFLFPLQPRLVFHEGAIWQNYLDIQNLKEKLELAESKLLALEAA